MPRLFPAAAVFCFALALFAGHGWAQEKVNPKPAEGQPVAWRAQDYLLLPGFWLLAQENVRQEIEIVPEQFERLKKISKQYQEEQRAIYNPLQKQVGERPKTPEEWQKLNGEVQKKFADLNEKYTALVTEVLLPHQRKALEDIDFRNKAGMMLQYPFYVEKLNLTDKQKEEVKKNRDALAKKIQKATQEALDEVLEVLTPEQIEILKQPWPGQQPVPVKSQN